MRQFLVVGHEGPTTAEFSLEDLPGAGRLDLLARSVTSAFLLSHAIRESVRCRLVLADEFTVRFEGAELRNLRPDERSTAALVRTALEARENAVGSVPAEPAPGVFLHRQGVEGALATAAGEGRLVQLHEAGEPAVDVEPPTDPVFVLSDHRDFTDREEALLADRGARRVRLGPEALHADQAVTVAHSWLDTDGWTAF
jgi:tRNA (pseudouridine54-N1)-methyltransferase